MPGSMKRRRLIAGGLAASFLSALLFFVFVYPGLFPNSLASQVVGPDPAERKASPKGETEPPRRPDKKRRPIKQRLIAAVLAAGILAAALFFLVLYPALFPVSVAAPIVERDPAEGKALLDGEIVLEVRGSLSEQEVLQSLDIRPAVHLDESDIKVEHLAPLPWHQDLPWAKTRVVLNPHRSNLFAAETHYQVSLKEAAATFETITVPKVIDVRQLPQADWSNLPTTTQIEITFNEEIVWRENHLRLEPAADVKTEATQAGGRTLLRISPVSRWQNGTTYSLSIDSAVEDDFGHPAGLPFARRFTTSPQPKVVSVVPEGQSAPIDSVLRMAFERPPDKPTAEASFHVEPAVPGSFQWESDTILAWHPAKLENSTAYGASIAGTASDGDPIVPKTWSFRTQDPPVSVAISGRGTAPAVLQAVPSGGLGSYSYQWNTGETAPRILFQGAPGQTQTAEVTVHSGDRTATASLQLARPAGATYNPLPCPEGWEMTEADVCYREEPLPGPANVFVARIDLNDPSMQLRSLPTGDLVSTVRPVSASERASDAAVAINADYFHRAATRQSTLGPMVSGGDFLFATITNEAALALDRARHPWTGSAAALRFGAQAADGTSYDVLFINDPPIDGQMALFNGYWGGRVSLGFDGCYALFTPTDTGPRVPDAFGCGPVDGIPIPAGGYVLVGRGGSADWLQQEAANPISIAPSLPLPDLDFMVAGSDILIKDGNPWQVPPTKADPQTALGMDANGFMYMIVADGRSNESVGLRLPELRDYALKLGVRDAIALDGGGSSTLVLNDVLRNRPSDGTERPVASLVEAGPAHPSCWHPFVRCQ